MLLYYTTAVVVRRHVEVMWGVWSGRRVLLRIDLCGAGWSKLPGGGSLGAGSGAIAGDGSFTEAGLQDIRQGWQRAQTEPCSRPIMHAPTCSTAAWIVRSSRQVPTERKHHSPLLLCHALPVNTPRTHMRT